MRHALRRAASATARAASSAAAPAPPYPRAAVAAVVFRDPPSARGDPHLLLVRRARPPHAGLWSFPGGKLESGETLLSGAARELKEETGLTLCCDRARSRALAGGVPFTAVDAITPGAFHYVIVEVAGVAAAGSALPTPGDDAADAAWVAADALAAREAGGDVTPGCAAVAAEAVARFCK